MINHIVLFVCAICVFSFCVVAHDERQKNIKLQNQLEQLPKYPQWYTDMYDKCMNIEQVPLNFRTNCMVTEVNLRKKQIEQ